MTDPLDRLFHALSDPTRRAILVRLAAGPATVSELAGPFDLALPTLIAHLSRLEAAGLVRSTKRGRVRTYRANPVALAPVLRWVRDRSAEWDRRVTAQAETWRRHAAPPSTDPGRTRPEDRAVPAPRHRSEQ